MPRQARYRIPGIPQHLVQRGNDRQPTFFAERDYQLYKRWLAEAAADHSCQVHAYVLMSNHVHLLATPGVANGLAKMMQSLGRRYVRYVNDVYGRSGTLWEGRYKACLVQTEYYLFACYRYIELNPVRAGIVANPAEYAQSSYRSNALGQPDPLVVPHVAYEALGAVGDERRRAYRAMFRPGDEPQAADEIRRVTAGCQVLGSESFKDGIEQALARPVRPGRAGRPRKIAV